MEQVREAAKLALTGPYVPALLLWTGKAAARLGDTTVARQLLDSARARTRATSAAELSATTGLEAELLVARGRLSEGVAAAERAVAIDSVAYLVETLAYALERAGRLQEARARQVQLAEGVQRQMGKEAQQIALLAPLAIARLDAQLGRTSDAERAVNQFAERWPTADANLRMITTLRARIAAQPREPATTNGPR
jgi:tetratricopeptide (TPR) repeat protein